MIEVRDIRKAFGAVQALDGVSFAARRGEVLGLLGPNGAGKSTALAVCTGLLAPDSGSVRIGDAGSPRERDARRLVGIAPQRIALYDQLTARENLAFLGRIHGIADPVRRADRLLDAMGLLPRARDRVGTFSGGMQRRLNLAAALVHEPPVLLLDEPTAGVDPQSRGAILDAVRGLAAAGHAVIYTTHYMEEAQRICTRVAVIDHGRILAVDTPDGLRTAHGGDLETAFLALTGRSLRD
jgi:ABC-2 type transport system ATP-binding protein